MSLSLFVIVFSLLAPALAAQVNTTVTAGPNSPILFSGSGWTDGQVWADVPPCGWSSDTNGDSAIFTFLGSALYVLGDKPSTDRFSDIVGTLDGQSVPLIAGEGPFCNEWAYAIEGLQEGLHTFIVTVQDNTLSNPPTFFSLISMTYTSTELDTTSSPGSTSSTTTESSTTVSSSSTSESATLTSTSSSSSDTSTSTTSSIPSTSSAPETTETSTSTSSSSSSSSSASSTSESSTTTSSSSSSSETSTSTTPIPTSEPATTSSTPPTTTSSPQSTETPTSTSSSAPTSSTSSTSSSSSSSPLTHSSTTSTPTSVPVTTSSSTPASSSSPATTSSAPATSSTPQTTETPTSTSSVPSTSSTSAAAPSVTFTFSSSGPSTAPTQTTSAVTSPTTSPTRTLIVSTTSSSSSRAVTTPATVSSSPTEATSEQPSETSTSTAPDPTVGVGVSSVVPSDAPSSSSSSSQQTSPVPVSSTIQPSPTPSSNNSTIAADHSLNGHNRNAVIAGSTVGGFTAAAILLAATYAATHPGWLEYVLIAISNALGIGAGYTVRRLIIKKHGNLQLSDTKIALFITTRKSDAFGLDDSVIVWQINNVNNQNDFFTVDIPCTKRLKTRLYFGTYVHADHSDQISVEHFGEAPATLEEDHGHIRWDRTLVDSGRAAARNMRQLPTSIVLGTGNPPVDKKEGSSPNMIPFLRIPDGDFRPGDTYEVQGNLYLRAFRVKSDCKVGQLGTAIPNPSEVVADELTKDQLIAIDKLAPLTTWNITGKKNGGLSLKITKSKKTDKKQYKHECVVEKGAQRGGQAGGDEENLVSA